jgi:alanyl-tRNA synthetase
MIESVFEQVREDYPKAEPAGLLQSRVAYGKFNPSAGHVIIDPILRENTPHKINSFSVIERCLREADSSRIGLSNRHLSFFEMMVFSYYGADSDLPFEKSTQDFYKLLTETLGLDKNKILVTILNNCEIKNLHIGEEETKRAYDAWAKFLPENQIKKTDGRRNFFIAMLPNAAGGTGAEIYYQMVNGEYVEIGSQVHYHYLYDGNSLKQTINGNIGSGIGLERVLMALEGKEKVYDVSLIKPLKEVICKRLEDEKTARLYDENVNVIADNIRAITFAVYEKERQNVKFTESQEKIFNKLKKSLNGEIEYLGIEKDIHKELIDTTIDLYKDRFKDLGDYKEKILAVF